MNCLSLTVIKITYTSKTSTGIAFVACCDISIYRDAEEDGKIVL